MPVSGEWANNVHDFIDDNPQSDFFDSPLPEDMTSVERVHWR